jgi:hypothetical protein
LQDAIRTRPFPTERVSHYTPRLCVDVSTQAPTRLSRLHLDARRRFDASDSLMHATSSNAPRSCEYNHVEPMTRLQATGNRQRRYCISTAIDLLTRTFLFLSTSHLRWYVPILLLLLFCSFCVSVFDPLYSLPSCLCTYFVFYVLLSRSCVGTSVFVYIPALSLLMRCILVHCTFQPLLLCNAPSVLLFPCVLCHFCLGPLLKHLSAPTTPSIRSFVQIARYVPISSFAR